ncbi:hypothetical protein GVAV_000224 [Gurleya vavrai]
MKKLYFCYFLIKAYIKSSTSDIGNSSKKSSVQDSILKSHIEAFIKQTSISNPVNNSATESKATLFLEKKNKPESILSDDSSKDTKIDSNSIENLRLECMNKILFISITPYLSELFDQNHSFEIFTNNIQNLESMIYDRFDKGLRLEDLSLDKLLKHFNFVEEFSNPDMKHEFNDYELKHIDGFFKKLIKKFISYKQIIVSIFEIYCEESENPQESRDFQKRLLVSYKVYKIKYLYFEIYSESKQHIIDNKNSLEENLNIKLNIIKKIFCLLQNYKDTINEVTSNEFFNLIFETIKFDKIRQLKTKNFFKNCFDYLLKYIRCVKHEKTPKQIDFEKYNLELANDLTIFFDSSSAFSIKFINQDEKYTRIKYILIKIFIFFDAFELYFCCENFLIESLTEFKTRLDQIKYFIVKIDLINENLYGLCFEDQKNHFNCDKNIDFSLNTQSLFILYDINKNIERLSIKIFESEKISSEYAEKSIINLCKSIKNNSRFLYIIIKRWIATSRA